MEGRRKVCIEIQVCKLGMTGCCNDWLQSLVIPYSKHTRLIRRNGLDSPPPRLPKHLLPTLVFARLHLARNPQNNRKNLLTQSQRSCTTDLPDRHPGTLDQQGTRVLRHPVHLGHGGDDSTIGNSDSSTRLLLQFCSHFYLEVDNSCSAIQLTASYSRQCIHKSLPQP